MGSLNSWKLNYRYQIWRAGTTGSNVSPVTTSRPTRLQLAWTVIQTLCSHLGTFDIQTCYSLFLIRITHIQKLPAWWSSFKTSTLILQGFPGCSILLLEHPYFLYHSICDTALKIFVSFSVYFPTTFLNSGRAKALFSWFILVSSGPPQCLLNNNTNLDVLSNMCQTLF